MKNSSFTPDAFMDELYSRLYMSPFADVHTADDVLSAGRKIREQLASALQNPLLQSLSETSKPEPVCAPLDVGTYTVQKYAVQMLPHLTVAVYLLTPSDISEKAPCVTALCGHGYGVRQIIGLTAKDRIKRLPFLDDYQRHFAVTLAKRGCIVAAPEMIAFGQARLKKDLHKPFYISSCEEISHHLLPYGLSTAAVRVFQALVCAKMLREHPNADLQKQGIMGISGGGLAALYASVLDTQIERTVISGYINTFKDSILSRWHCPDNYIPGILQIGEIYDFACAIAPRRLLIESGEKDALFPIDAAGKAHKEIARVYNLAGAADNLKLDVFNGKHRVNGKYAFDFLCQ